MVSSTELNEPWIMSWKSFGAAEAATSTKRLYSSSVVPHSDTSSVPENPSAAVWRMSWAIAASFSERKSLVKVGMTTLQTPFRFWRAQSFASPRV